jgi:hypothetical protein
MGKPAFLACTISASICAFLTAQPQSRRPSLIDGGNSPEGKCAIDVVVHGSADVVFRGDTAVLSSPGGPQPEWRSFECTARMPQAPADLRVRAIEGRGSVQLNRDRASGAPVVQIDSRSGSAERYTFELLWSASPQRYDPDARGSSAGAGIGYGSNSNQRRDIANQRERMAGAVYSADDAVRACEEGVREQAAARLGTGELQFREAGLDNAPNRAEWVGGSFLFLGRNRSEVVYRFSCAIDFNAGRVRSVQFDPAAGDAYASARDRMPPPVDPAILRCQDAVLARLDRLGYAGVTIASIAFDQRRGGDEWVTGEARGSRGTRPARLDFSCRMNLNDGNVRTLNVTRR